METEAAQPAPPAGLLHRPCLEYMQWTGYSVVYVCSACGEEVDLAESDETEDE